MAVVPDAIVVSSLAISSLVYMVADTDVCSSGLGVAIRDEAFRMSISLDYRFIKEMVVTLMGVVAMCVSGACHVPPASWASLFIRVNTGVLSTCSRKGRRRHAELYLEL